MTDSPKYDALRQVLQQWLDGINSGDVDGVTSLYKEDAVLLPTFSSRRLTRPAERRAYFERVSSKLKLSVELHQRTLVMQQFSDSIHGLSGIYLWRFEEDEEMLSFEARFTYTVDLSRPDPILHHHSSQIPRTV